MPKISIAVPHAMSQEDATARLQSILEKIRESYSAQVSDLKEEWQGNTLNFAFKTFGMAVKGAMHVEPNQVKVEGDLPFAAMMFKGRVEQEVKDKLTRWLA